MKSFVLAGAAAAAILGGGAAIAQTSKATAQTGAGRAAKPATRAEVPSHVARLFAKLDANKDGFVTREEVTALETRRDAKLEQRAQRFDPAKMFERIDLNHDGKITVAEAQAARSQRGHPAKAGETVNVQATAFGGLFAKADANKDAVITRAEFNAMGQQIKARMEKAGMAKDKMASRMFDAADANRDGRVSLAEMQQAALTRFDKLDANRDGKISPDERQLRKAAKGQRKPS